MLLTAPHQKQAEEKSKVYSCPFFFPGYLFPLFFLFCLKERGLELIQKRVWTAQKIFGSFAHMSAWPSSCWLWEMQEIKRLSHAVKNCGNCLIFVEKQQQKHRALQTILCCSCFEYVLSLKASFWSFSVCLGVRAVCYPVLLRLINPYAFRKWGGFLCEA